jgi:hypothetical protein
MINEFEYKGRKFKRIDFKNQYTFEQSDEFDKINTVVTDVATYLNNAQKSGLTELQMGIELKKKLQTSKVFPELLAHVWYDAEDSEFNIENFKTRIDFFKKMPLGVIKEKGISEGVQDFLLEGMKSSTEGIQSLLPTAKK